MLKTVSQYEYGKSRSWLQEYHDVMAEVYNVPEIHGEVEQLMIKLLYSSASNDAKQLVCGSLGTIGGDASLPVLKRLLLDPETSSMALMAMGPLRSEQADQVLIDAMSEAEQEILVGIMNTLALRQNPEAVEPVSKFMQSDHPMVKKSAIHALGTLGGIEAAELIFDAFLSDSTDLKWLLSESLLKCLEKSEVEEAERMFSAIYNSNPPISIKYGAYSGLVNSMPEEDMPSYLLNTLRTSDESFQEAIIPLVRKLPPECEMVPFINEIPQLPYEIRLKWTLAIADRKDSSVRPLIPAMLKSDDAEERIVGLKCMLNIANEEDIVLLARVAAKNPDPERELARKCLYFMEGDNTDGEILNAVEISDEFIKPELIKCIGYRGISEGNELVIKYLNSNMEALRLESIISIGMIAGEEDLGKVTDLMLEKIKVSEKDEIEESITNIINRINQPEEALDVLNEKLALHNDELSLITLIRVLGNIGGEKAYGLILPYLASENEQIQVSAIEVYSSWENDEPLPELEKIIQSDLPQQNHSQALVGIVYLVQNSKNLNEEQKSMRLKAAFQYAKTIQDKKIVINGISRINSMEALVFSIGQLEDESIRLEAQDAVIRISGNLRGSQFDLVTGKMDSLMQVTDDQEFKDRIEIVLKSMEL